MDGTFRRSMPDQFSLLTIPRILMAFIIPSHGFGTTYAVYKYLVPILKGMKAISLILFGYGFTSNFNNILAGKIASYNAIESLRFVFLVQAIVSDQFLLDDR
ncbi:MFS transporter [Bacillus sp. ISL-4]|uniref:hypothetical protein n=1 Tax=Bacillus sp. ISL-4 TaxID=2819125 RepID=UPI001BE9A4B3|nr:hypothetical protein [Bacillus sp. ISL-4]MBT2667093.1 MFS transporter [Bacillus sp. ISL-4]